MPKLKELHGKHKDQGLVLIGVHSTNGGEKMAAFVEEQGIDYPVAIDVNDATRSAYLVDGFPDYHIIDRSGNVRVADCANGGVAAVVEALLAEPAPAAVPAALAAASEVALRKDKRILALFAAGDAAKAQGARLARRAAHGRLVFNEYELVTLDPSVEAELARAAGVTGAGPVLAVYDARGGLVAAAPAPEDEAALGAFLESHRVPVKDAAALLTAAQERARAEKKRVLVHLGAPW